MTLVTPTTEPASAGTAPVLGRTPFPIIGSCRLRRRHFARDMFADRGMPMWTVYVRPSDYPDHYVLRRRDIYPGREVVRPGVTLTASLEEARSTIPGYAAGRLVAVAAAPADDPVIVETWF